MGVQRLDATDWSKSKVQYKFYVGTRRPRRSDHPGFSHWMRQVRSLHYREETGRKDDVPSLKTFLNSLGFFDGLSLNKSTAVLGINND